MSTFTAIDLSALPMPDFVETLDFETLLAAYKADFIARYPALAAALDLESEPVVKLLETGAYRELLVRARVNDAGRANMLATSTGADLDNLAALYGVSRLVTAPGDSSASPPVAPTFETDGVFRARIQLALEGFSTAGPVGAYRFHALSADGRVKDVGVASPSPGVVRVTVLSSVGNGTATGDLLLAVDTALAADDVRPLCDTVTVQGATIVPFSVSAQLELLEGPDAAVVLAEAQAALAAHVADVHRIGRSVSLSGLYAALHRGGVAKVNLIMPAAEIDIGETEAPWCTAANVTIAGTP